MPVQDAGESYPMSDANILEIDSPNDERGGSEVGIIGKPHVVVAKNEKHRWAIVALTRWAGNRDDQEHRLGIRWFHSSNGHPISNRYAVWFILPQELHLCTLQGLEISEGKRKLAENFLDGNVDGPTFADQWEAA